jgi:preprotein translocase subunit SecG
MLMTEQIILVAHLLIALAIIGLIMLQQGKGADMGASFGAGASQTLFGSEGSGNVLTRATTLLAVAFFATSFGLAIVAQNKAGVTDDMDILVPEMMQVEPAAEVDVPQVGEDAPATMTVEDDIPEVE